MKPSYLYPGKIIVTKDDAQITTILGSCVAVALQDRTNKISGLNHYLMPKNLNNDRPSGRFGEFAIKIMIDEMLKLGAVRQNLEAKVYGGANVLTDVDIGFGIGQKNIALAHQLLAEYKIPIREHNTGGERSRKIIFHTKEFSVEHIFSKELESKEKNKIRVAIVDDSATVRNLFQNIFTKAKLEVVGTAADPYAARQLIVDTKPDVVTLDIEMPKMNGVAFLEKLMKYMPVPVVMVSSLGQNGEAALRSLELGAVEFVHKPSQFDPEILRQLGEILVEKVKAAANSTPKKNNATATVVPVKGLVTEGAAELKAIGISGNIGSPDSLEKILKNLPADTPPVLISDSTISYFLEAFIAKLKKQVRVNMQIVTQRTVAKMGTVYFAGADKHMKVVSGDPIAVDLEAGPPVWGQRPSGDILLSSLAQAVGKNSLAILLSGFGNDGVDGIKKIYNASGRTIVENPELCAFPQGVKRATELGVAEFISESDRIANLIMEVRNQGVVWKKRSAS